jgi:hypothetical protein
MNTKEIIMKKLGWDKLSKKASRLVGYDTDGTMVHNNLGDEVLLEVVRFDEQKDFVLGHYDHKARLYRVAYAANMKAGRIKTITHAYTKG